MHSFKISSILTSTLSFNRTHQINLLRYLYIYRHTEKTKPDRIQSNWTTTHIGKSQHFWNILRKPWTCKCRDLRWLFEWETNKRWIKRRNNQTVEIIAPASNEREINVNFFKFNHGCSHWLQQRREEREKKCPVKRTWSEHLNEI